MLKFIRRNPISSGLLSIFSVKNGYLLVFLIGLMVSCAGQPAVQEDVNLPSEKDDPFSKTLSSLQKIDDYPFYVMEYSGDYNPDQISREIMSEPIGFGSSWACSLFTSLAAPSERMYGRNFDWQHSPALLLLTNPSDGYRSVSMVNLDFLGISGSQARELEHLERADLEPLRRAPWLPIDGMNEKGLAIGMAAVPSDGNIPVDPGKETVGSLMIMRIILDKAASVDEAVNIMKQYNVDMGGGPPIHYLISDAGGRAALVEYFDGEMKVYHNQEAWLQATNFLVSVDPESPEGSCDRYDRIEKTMEAQKGRLASGQAMDLLEEVSQVNTQWSVVYDMSDLRVLITVGRNYDQEPYEYDILK